MTTDSPFRRARTLIDPIFDKGLSRDDLFREVVRVLHEQVPHYDWVGIYLMDGPKDLQLHSYLGRPTPHERIPVDQGICGAAIRDNDTVIVDDVHADDRYLSCSVETSSEIVVPIRVKGEPVGEIDIDSDNPSAFGEEDRRFLESVAEKLARSF